MLWIIAAILSAFFAGLTSILAKCGIRKTDPDLATAIRTGVVLLFSWLMVAFVGSAGTISQIGVRSVVFLVLSGLATGASWLCYFKALSEGEINKVVPIDKSSVVLSVLLAILLFGETGHLAVRLVCTAAIAAGTLLMIEKKPEEGKKTGRAWMLYAVLSAVFAAVTPILARIGIGDVESNLGTAIRTAVVLIMAWVVVLIKGKQPMLRRIPRGELGFLLLSGLATGASWLFYYYAIGHGKVSVVVPIDKMSILVTVLFSRVVFGEKLSEKAAAGLALISAATVCMALLG